MYYYVPSYTSQKKRERTFRNFICFHLPPPVKERKNKVLKDVRENSSFSLQTVHFKVHDPKMHCKGSSRENTISRYGPAGGKYGMRPIGRYDEEAPPPMHPHHMGPPPLGPPPQLPPMPPPQMPPPPPPPPPPPNPECDMKDLNKMFGMTASDIDKYSRVIFPVTFTCFQLMYWIIYQHLSDDIVDDLVYLQPE